MTDSIVNHYVDRSTGALRRERVYANRFLRWSYNTKSGLALTNALFSQVLVSRLYALIQQSRLSRRKIRAFVNDMGIDVAETERPLTEYRSFAEFFGRRLVPGARPIDENSKACIAPVDGKVMAYQSVGIGTKIRIKRHEFTLESFLRGHSLARHYDGGAVITCRLGLADYHHVHFPDSGVPRGPHRINGKLYAGGPYAVRHLIPFYSENLREVTPFESDHFGRVLIVEVGAFTVGSIRHEYVPGARVAKGDHKGCFELGGSTVVLVFEPWAIKLDDDLIDNTQCGLETYVRMGQRIGIAQESAA